MFTLLRIGRSKIPITDIRYAAEWNAVYSFGEKTERGKLTEPLTVAITMCLMTRVRSV